MTAQMRGKSGLHKATVPGNARPGKLEGQRHRNQTSRLVWVKVKRRGKSSPRPWQQGWHGKPHREQCQIGTARRKARTSWPSGPGWQLEGPW